MEKWKGLYNRHREAICYLFFGALTTIVSIASYAALSRLFLLFMEKNAAIYGANLLSILISITFAYVTNRRYVFLSRAKGKALWAEMASFYLGRGITLLLDMALMAFFISGLHIWDLLAKTAVTVVVIFVNYVISKYIVFRRKRNGENAQ
jgi:putative flippase GtrA